MPAKKTPATAAALADAFASLSVEGKPVTVRTLRERAGVSTDAAAEWLRTNRPARDVSPPPADVLTRVLEPLWSAAVAVARDEQAEVGATERAALVQAEADALAELAAQIERAAVAVAAVKDAAAARVAQHAAELLAAEAQATARTLREVLDTLRRSSDSAAQG